MCEEEQVSLNRFSLEIQLCSARPAWSQSSTAPPRPMYDEGARFVPYPVRARKSFKETKKTVEAAQEDRSLSSLQRYKIIKQARGRHLNLKKTVRTANINASVATAVADDQRIDTRSLHAAHGV